MAKVQLSLEGASDCLLTCCEAVAESLGTMASARPCALFLYLSCQSSVSRFTFSGLFSYNTWEFLLGVHFKMSQSSVMVSSNDIKGHGS